MKKTFITGLVILLPLAVTLAILIFIFNLLTDPFADIVTRFLDRYDLLERDFFFASAHTIQYYFSKVLILVFLFFFTVLLGAIARYFLVNYLLRWWDYIIHKIPLVRTIYKISQDVINTIFTSNNKSFKQVVLVPFPQNDVYSIGLVTQDEFIDSNEHLTNQKVAVFVPTTPNPTSGFLMMYKRDEVVFLNMKVEDAFKYVISCGVIQVPFQRISYEEAKQSLEQTEMEEKK